MTNALDALKKQRPRPLVATIALLADTEVSEQEIAEFIGAASENEPALTALRTALATWDSQDELIDVEGLNVTQARTMERRRAVYAALRVTEELAAVITDRAPVSEKPGIVISKIFEPWYDQERVSRSSVYWDDYERYLRDKSKWSAEAIANLDETTTSVIRRLSRPTRLEAKQTKGLVVGYVQSGKTANFTGVAAKAIDVGYRLVIVLTGTIEILRSQTQRRMDMELIGVENILDGRNPDNPKESKLLDYQQDSDWASSKFVKHGAALDQGGVVRISRITSHNVDYDHLPGEATKLRFFRAEKGRPLNDTTNLFKCDAYIAIVKKNVAPLTKLVQDLGSLREDLSQLPVLIIDDESDQASVDTTRPDRKKKGSAESNRTAINGLITQILAICPRAQYVGYTATPFANVFVDPDEHEITLFPSDFVLSLHRPPGYMGVQEFHDVGKRWDDEQQTVSNSNELAHVRALRGDAETNPAGRLTELQEAVDAWVLSGAVKKFREEVDGSTFRHHTMLIHESVRTGDHSDTARDVRRLWSRSGFTTGSGLARLKKLYEEDFHPVSTTRAGSASVPESFDQLRPFIAKTVAQMTIDGDPVLIVNSDKEVQKQQKKLDFDTDQVWRILVGGAQLSRGFTVEGLTISYFRRKPGQADTLMQAGRWFGFRAGYQDLVRLYIRRDAADASPPRVDLYKSFEALLMDEEAFRDELRQYEGLDEKGAPLVEPRQIPPLVSQHLTSLKPTARSKMWNAVIVNKAPTRIQDLFGLPEFKERRKLQANFDDVFVPLLKHATSEVQLPYSFGGRNYEQRAHVGLVGSVEFLELFDRLAWNPKYEKTIITLRAFLRRATNDTIRDWAVVWPWPDTGERALDIPELGLDKLAPIVQRSRRDGRIDFVGSDSKQRAAAEPIVEGREVPAIGNSPTRGVALISITSDTEKPSAPLERKNLVGLLSIAVPRLAVQLTAPIQWGVVVPSRPYDIEVDRTLTGQTPK